MIVLKCNQCGNELELLGDGLARCKTCGSLTALPAIDDDVRAQLWNRGVSDRRNYEFDRAAASFESIISKDPKDAEAYFALLLCRYGVEYVEDPRTGERKPTCHRTLYASILDDADYQNAIAYAHPYRKEEYQRMAKQIHQIQEEILKIAQAERPYDVFLCYKETASVGADPENRGRTDKDRTPDSFLAEEIYEELTRRGLHVFFSRVTLQDKLGRAYEPYIFSALQTAKVMIVAASRPGYIETAWVRNEWRRYLELAKRDHSRHMIVAYQDFDEYDVPDDLANKADLQNMRDVGAMQDLVRITVKMTNHLTDQTIRIQNQQKEEYLLRFLQEGNYSQAQTLAEEMVAQEPENGYYYRSLFLAKQQASTLEELAFCAEKVEEALDFKRMMRYAQGDLKAQGERFLQMRKKRALYDQAMEAQERQDYVEAERLYAQLISYLDSDSRLENVRKMAKQQQQEAILQKNQEEYTRKYEAIAADTEEEIVREHPRVLKWAQWKSKPNRFQKKTGILPVLLSIFLFGAVQVLYILYTRTYEIWPKWQSIIIGSIVVYAFVRSVCIVRFFQKEITSKLLRLVVGFFIFGAMESYSTFLFETDLGWEEGLIQVLPLVAVNLAVSLVWFGGRSIYYQIWITSCKKSEQARSITLPNLRKQIRERRQQELNQEYQGKFHPESVQTDEKWR